MDVEPERHRCATECGDAFGWFKASCQAYFDDAFSECSAVGDHVDLAGANVCCAVVVLGDRLVNGFES